MDYKALSDEEKKDIIVFRLRELEKRYLEMSLELAAVNHLISIEDSPYLQDKKSKYTEWLKEVEEETKELSSGVTSQEITDSLARLPKLNLSGE